MAVAAGVAAGPDRGAALGFAAGLAYDLMLQTPFGLSALTYAIVAYLVGGLQDSVLRAAWWIPVITATAASMAGVILYGVFGTVLGEDLIGYELVRIAVIVGLLNTIAAPVVVRAMRWATGSTSVLAGAGGVPVIAAESPRVRMSVLGIVVFALFAALFSRLWYLQVMASEQYQVAAQANRIRVVPVEAPRGRILDRNGKVLVDNRISVQITVDRTVINDLDDAERTRVLTAIADGLARSSTPKTVEQLEEDLANQRYSPYVPVPVANDVPEELKIWIDEHGADLPGVEARRVAIRHYPYRPARRPRARVHGPDHRRGVRGEGGVGQAVHAQRPDREVRGREDLRGRPPGHVRARGRSRSTPRTTRSAWSTRTRRSPATTWC